MEEKYTKLKRFILFAVLVTLAVLGWHFYEHLFEESRDAATETLSEHELHEFTQQLYEEELKSNPLPLVKLNLQSKTHTNERHDRATAPLLHLDRELLNGSGGQLSTLALMQRLFDNYELNTHTVEHVTLEEQKEELDFLHAIMQTPIMKHTMEYLRIKGIVNYDQKAQLRLLQDIWFTQYSRGRGYVGSSGFEHVFLAEIKEQNILGLHNWLYLAEQESLGTLDYKGYIERLELSKEQQLLAIRFTFHNLVKSYNTLFVGTSPELEMSLYTVCFLLSAGQPCPVQLGHAKFNIITHAWDWHGKRTLATAYPSMEK